MRQRSIALAEKTAQNAVDAAPAQVTDSVVQTPDKPDHIKKIRGVDISSISLRHGGGSGGIRLNDEKFGTGHSPAQVFGQRTVNAQVRPQFGQL